MKIANKQCLRSVAHNTEYAWYQLRMQTMLLMCIATVIRTCGHQNKKAEFLCKNYFYGFDCDRLS